ncbi:MAG: hypothetical protein IJN69_07305 [Oscillospiraceae bacterium]|nr:hypothetical protein [Oscillospiraceae bacterium]
MKKIKFQDLLESNRFLLFFSFLLAVMFWIIVVTFFSTEARATIKNVPVNVDYNATYQNLDLEIIEKDIEFVDVTVTGPRSVIGNLTKDDIIVYPQFNNVRVPGKYDLALNAVKTSAIMEYQIESLSSYQITARFDSVIEKTFPVEIDISNIVIPGEYMVDKIYATPESVTITGPEKSVSVISRVVATVEPQEISQTAVLDAKLTMYDETETEIDSTYFSYDQDEFTVTVPILKEVVVPVKVEYINIPEGFDVSTFDVEFSQDKVDIAVPARVAESMTEYTAGYIDLKTLAFDSPYVFDLTTQTGYRFMDGLTELSATISAEGIGRKNISVSEIKVLNQGSQKVEVLTDVINNVEIVGAAADVEALTDDSVVAEIDMTKVSLAQGQQTVAVDIIITSTHAAYARGTYYVTIKN